VRHRAWGAAAAATLVVLGGCFGTRPVPAGRSLVVFAAASLGTALGAVETAFRADHPDVTFTTSTSSSAAAATQIEHGAPADVFLSADVANAQRLMDEGLAGGQAVMVATNRLVVIAPATNPAGITSPADLARPGLKVIAAGDEVPITEYASRVVDNLAELPGYPADFAAGYRSNVVSREESVSGVLTKVSLGEGDAGIVYATDAAAAAGEVLRLEIPEAANVLARYAGVTLASSTAPTLAAQFLAWLAGPDGQRVLSTRGFGPPS